MLGLALEQKRAEAPFRITGKPRLIRQQLDAAVTGLGIHRADVPAFLLEAGQRGERGFGRCVLTDFRFATHPDLGHVAEVGDGFASGRIDRFERGLRVVGQLRGVVQVRGLEGSADVLVVDEGIQIEPAISLFQQLEGVDGGADGLAVFRFPAQVAGLHAQRAVEQVIDLGIDPGDLGDQFAVFLRLGGEQLIGLEAGAQVGDDDLRVFFRVALIDQRTVEGRCPGLGTVIDLACEAPAREQLGERHEVGMGVDLAGLQGGAGDFRWLGNDVHVFERVPSLGRHGTQQHAMGGRGERHGNGLALQLGQRLHARGARHDDAVATALDAARQHADEQAVLARRFERHTVERTGEIGHGAEVEFAGNHLVGQGRAAGEVFPLHVVLRVLVLPVVGQVFVEQAQFADQQTASGAVDRGVLGADGNADGLGRGRQGE